MTTQRQTGLFLTLFTSAVVFNHWVHAELTIYDAIYAIMIAPLAITGFLESAWCKGIQVLVIAWVGIMMVYAGEESIYLGVVIMVAACLFSYTYGFLETWPRVKMSALAGVFVVTVLIATDLDPLRAGTWIMMGVGVLWVFWLNAKHLIEKDRKASEIIQMDLKRRAAMSEALLEETVKAGMVLVEEIKNKDAENGCN